MTASRLHIGIVTIAEDLHADVVSAELRTRGHTVSVMLQDCLPGYGGMSWSSNQASTATMRTASGSRVALSDFDVAWWRRTAPGQVPERVIDPAAREYVEAACSATAFGLWHAGMGGHWVSDPSATRRAENKVIQLQAALGEDLRVPPTLISQDPTDIRAFVAEFGAENVIAKAVTGVRNLGLAAGVLNDAMLDDDDALSVAPSIFQALVPGSQHLRICCFGDDVIGTRIDAREVDWRYERGARVAPSEVDPELATRLVSLLRRLDIEMGIFDLKVPPDGVPVFLEVNPQGQFLFLEAMGGPRLGGAMADFLVRVGHRSQYTLR